MTECEAAHEPERIWMRVLDMFRPLLIRCPRSQGPNAGVQRDGKTSVEGGEGGLEEVWTCNIFFLRLSDFAGFDVIL